jgi:hypothetical protein
MHNPLLLLLLLHCMHMCGGGGGHGSVHFFIRPDVVVVCGRANLPGTTPEPHSTRAARKGRRRAGTVPPARSAPVRRLLRWCADSPHPSSSSSSSGVNGGAIVNGAASQTHTILLFSPSLPLVASPTNSHEQTSAGAEAVSWLLKHRYAQTRVEAVMVGNDLMDAGHFHHVADKTDYVGACPI